MVIERPDGTDGRSGENDWFAVRVKSNYERIANSALSAKGFEVCLPLCRSRRAPKRHLRERKLPISCAGVSPRLVVETEYARNSDRLAVLFPGYVFCYFDRTSLMPVLTTPGVVGIVCCGRTPEPVDPVEMLAVKRLTESGVVYEPYPYLEVGQRVCVLEGPLEGVEGVLLRERGADRLVLSVSLLQRSVIAEVERSWVEPLATVRKSA